MSFTPNDSTPIGFWCRYGLNLRPLIQLSETLEEMKFNYDQYPLTTQTVESQDS